MKFQKGSGNIFKDLDFKEEEANSLLIRSQLMSEIEKFIEEEKLTQISASEIFGVTQPRISDLKRGKVSLFTVDTLIDMLGKVGLNVSLTIDDKVA